jgi:hypothetical protein
MCGFFEGRYRVPGIGYRLSGTGYWIRAEGRTPNTEDRAKPAHGVCMMQDRKGSDSDYLVPGTWHLGPGLNAPEELRS